MTKASHKYSANDPAFDAKHGVLKNKLGLTREGDLQIAENQALLDAYYWAGTTYAESHTFTAADVCRLHNTFLGGIYEWAGTYRNIDISSPGIRWCHAKFIGQEMAKFGIRMKELTPFSPDWSRGEIIVNLAEIHGELVVIHPFRDGNGRTTRLLCDLLLMQARLPMISPEVYDDKETQTAYFTAIHNVWGKADYAKLIRFFELLVAA